MTYETNPLPPPDGDGAEGEYVDPDYDALAQRVEYLEAANERLERQKCIDHVLHTPNRYGMEKWFDTYGEEGDICVVVDLVGFKSVNDLYGHDEGDNILRQAVFQLDSFLNVALTGVWSESPEDLRKLDEFMKEPNGVVFRSGGDEFGMIISKTHLAAEYAELYARDKDALHTKILEAIEAIQMRVDNDLLDGAQSRLGAKKVGIRAGMAYYHGKGIHPLLRAADYDMTNRRLERARIDQGRFLTMLARLATHDTAAGRVVRAVTAWAYRTSRHINPDLKRQ